MASRFRDDEFTGRIGPDGEPERWEDVRGGDPRLLQELALEEYERRLASPIELESWMTGANRDVRGLDAASRITLTPGTRYQLRDYTGSNSGQVIASGSTPDELLRLQDMQRGLASQGRMADYRIEQVGGPPTDGLAQYTDPTTGETVTLLGGDLYNRPGTAVIGDIAKIAVPIALNVIPGLGMGAGLLGKAASGTLLGKAAGIGLTTALGRAGAGVATGEDLGDALKAGAVGGLVSAATAGLLGVTELDKALNSILPASKSALAGSAAQEAAGQGISEAAKRAMEAGMMEVVAQRIAPSLISGGLSAASGSLLGNVGQSLTRLDPFQQALDQARLDNEFGLGDTVVTGSRIPAAGLDSAVAGALPSSLDIGTPTDTTLPGEELIDVAANRIRPSPISSGLAAGTAGAVDFNLPGEQIIDVAADRIRPGQISNGLAAGAGSVIPLTGTTPVMGSGAVGEEVTVTGKKTPPNVISGTISGLTGTLPTLPGADLVADAGAGQDTGKKGSGTLGKVAAGLTIASALADAVGGGGGGGGGIADPGTGYAVGRGGIGRVRAPMTFDPFTYGQREGEFEFFRDAPASGAGMAEGGEVYDDMVSHLIAYRKGGGHMGPGQVKGIGSGQEDKIPAWLSDGEYVWSAQDVADLGDGSTDEGVRRLDKMRKMVRQRAGRKDVKKIAKPQRGIEDMLKAVGGVV